MGLIYVHGRYMYTLLFFLFGLCVYDLREGKRKERDYFGFR